MNLDLKQWIFNLLLGIQICLQYMDTQWSDVLKISSRVCACLRPNTHLKCKTHSVEQLQFGMAALNCLHQLAASILIAALLHFIVLYWLQLLMHIPQPLNLRCARSVHT